MSFFIMFIEPDGGGFVLRAIFYSWSAPWTLSRAPDTMLQTFRVRILERKAIFGTHFF